MDFFVSSGTTTTLPDDGLFYLKPDLNRFEKLPYNEKCCWCVYVWAWVVVARSALKTTRVIEIL